jgi:hypothetical protein
MNKDKEYKHIRNKINEIHLKRRELNIQEEKLHMKLTSLEK